MTTRVSNPTLINLGAIANNGQGTTLRDGGNIINDNFSTIYTAVNQIIDYTLPTASNSVLGGVIVDGTTITINSSGVISAGAIISPATVAPLVDGVAAVGTSLLYARQDHVHPAAAVVSPIVTGIIVMWSGATTAVPTGWLLCDGTNGTPDLRNRFIVGAGTTYTVAQTGGSANSTVVSHSHSLAAATFTGSALPTHDHTITDPGHNHTYVTHASTTGGSGSGTNFATDTTGTTGTATTGITIAAASAGTPAGTIGGSTDITGASGTNANLPPYFALAYIMKQ